MTDLPATAPRPARLAALGAVSLLLASGLAACSSSSPAAGSGRTPSTITIASPDTPDTLDPQKTGAAVTAQILQYVGNTLVTVDPYTRQVVPGLAARWTVSSNQLTYTFYLRHHVTFQDGTPFNAAAMAFTLSRAMNPATHGNIAAADLKPVTSVSVVSPYVLKIVLSKPYAPFLSVALSSPDLMAISPTAVRKEGGGFANHPVGTGPLAVSSYIPGNSLTLVRNPNYHWAPSFFSNRGPVKFNRLVFDFISNTSTVLAGLRTGSIDVGQPSAQQVRQFQNNSAYRVVGAYKNGLGLFVVMNFNNPALRDLAVRQAINYAINRKEVVRLALAGAGSPAYSPLPPTIFGYDPASVGYGYHYDPAKAKALLSGAGFTMGPRGYRQRGSTPLNFTFYIAPVTGWTTAASVIQQNLAAVGIRTTIHSMDIGTLITNMEKGQQDLGIMSYLYTDPDVLYLFFDSSQLHSGLNMSQYSSPTLDRLLSLGRATSNPSQRIAVYHQVQRYMVAQAVIAPVYNLKIFTVVSTKVLGLSVAPGGIIEVQDVA